MKIIHLILSLLIAAALFAGGADANDFNARVSAGDVMASHFTIGDSQCILKDDQILCTPRTK